MEATATFPASVCVTGNEELRGKRNRFRLADCTKGFSDHITFTLISQIDLVRVNRKKLTS